MGSLLYDTFFKSFSSKYCKEFKMYRKGKDIRKRDIKFLSFQICVHGNQLISTIADSVFVTSVFGEKFPTADF